MICRPTVRGNNVLFSFEDFVLDNERRELRAGGTIVPLEPQVFDLLVYLIENRDRVVSKDDLIASVWGGRIVSDSTLSSRINAARKAIGDSGAQQKLIRTIARKGLRFIGEVSMQEDDAAGPAKRGHSRGSRRSDRDVRPYCHAGGGRARWDGGRAIARRENTGCRSHRHAVYPKLPGTSDKRNLFQFRQLSGALCPQYDQSKVNAIPPASGPAWHE